MGDRKINIIIVEDNADLRMGYQMLIHTSTVYEVEAVFESCEACLKKIGMYKPDIILMDIDLPGMNGIEGTAKIKVLLPKTEIIIVTVFENSDRVFDALCAGASGYLTKNANQLEILSALDEVMKGGSPMSANIARMVVHSFQKNKSTNPLSDREEEVLKLLAEGKSYKSIAALLHVSLDTVKFHIKNIYLKLQVNSREDAIAIAKGKNWI